jgi:hypothetical protein
VVDGGFLYYKVPVTAVVQGRDEMDALHSMGKAVPAHALKAFGEV